MGECKALLCVHNLLCNRLETPSSSFHSLIGNRDWELLLAVLLTRSLVGNRDCMGTPPSSSSHSLTRREQGLGTHSSSSHSLTRRIQGLGTPSVSFHSLTRREQRLGTPSSYSLLANNREHMYIVNRITPQLHWGLEHLVVVPSLSPLTCSHTG